MKDARLSSWEDVAAFLYQQPMGTRLCMHKGILPHPQVFQMSQVIYPPQGQLATYYKALSPTAGLVVRDFASYYDVQIDPRSSPVVPEVALPPQTEAHQVVAGGTAFGAVVGSALGRSSGAVAAAALLGGTFAALLITGLDRAIGKPMNDD